MRLRILVTVAVAALCAAAFNAEAQADTIICQPDVTCYGTSGNDLISGTEGPDLIHGKGGHDEIYGNGGKDEIHGGDAGDTIYPGPGGQAKSNIVYGGSGYDEINGIDDVGNGCPDLWVDGGDGEDTAWAFGFLAKISVEHWGTFLC